MNQHLEIPRPLCTCPLTEREAMELDDRITGLLQFLGRPGDWGYGTRLGDMTIQLSALRNEIRAATATA